MRASAGDLDSGSDASGATCATNEDCATLKYNVCDQTAHACVSLTTNECPEILGNYLDPNAVLFGAIVPSPLASPPIYLTNLARTGDAMRDGLALAVADFASDKNPLLGLPPAPNQTAPRPIAVMVCTDGHSADVTATATTYLASTMKVPAIIGTALSTHTRTIVSTLASIQKTDTLLLVPRSSDLAPVDNAGHFLRLAPSDDVQGAALSALVASRETAMRAAVPADGGTGDIKIALVYKQDAYGNAVAASVKRTLRFNGKDVAGNGANFKEVKYGNPEDPAFQTTFFTSAVSPAANFRPQGIILVGSNEAPLSLLAQIESGLASVPSGERPRWFLSDQMAVPELWDYLAASDNGDSVGTRKRILGTITTGSPARFNPFANAFAAKNPDSSAIIYGAASMYDALYLLAYSATGLSDRPINGPNLLDGIGLLQGQGGALQVGVGPDSITPTFNKLLSGQSVNLEGASSTLTFDPTSHVVVGTTTQVWCVPSVSGVAKPAILSGQTVDVSNTVQGTLSASCAQ